MKSLQGGDIETFANELFRFWKLGEAKKNNGVLFLVAPAEHKVRIEVGYGLEGTLTDALSSVIIQSAVMPRFKANDYSGGIERGVDGIISVLSGDTADWQRKDRRSPGRYREHLQSAAPVPVVLCVRFRIPLHGLARQRPVIRPLRQAQRAHGFHTVSRWQLGWRFGLVGLGRRIVWRRIRRRILRRRGFVGRRRRVRGLVSHADHSGGPHGDRGRDPSGGATHQRTARLRARPRVVGLRHRSDPLGERARTRAAMAADLSVRHGAWSGFSWRSSLVFIAAGLLFSWTPLRLCACAARACSARGRTAPRSNSFSSGASATPPNRSGVLIFVSLAERYARIIADEGIAAKVPNAEWQAAIDALTGHMRDGRIAAGFIAAIERCGAVLAQHAPPDGSPNVLPDRLYVM